MYYLLGSCSEKELFAPPEKNDDSRIQAKADRRIMGELIKLISRSTKNKMNV